MNIITKPNFLLNKKKRKLISLRKKNNHMYQRIEDVLKLNLDGYDKKYINIAKSTEFKEKQKQEKEDDSNNITKNPLLLSSSIRQIQRFLPNINVLLNTESNFNYNPSRQEHIKFEEQIKKDISTYVKEETNLREKLIKIEKKILNLEDEILDSKIAIQALKTISVTNTKSPLRKNIIKKLEDEFCKEEEKYLNNYKISYKYLSPNRKKIKMRGQSLPGIDNSDFTSRLNLKLMESEKLNKEREKNVEENIGIIENTKYNIHNELNKIKSELKVVHCNKKFLINQLYNHYLAILKEGKDSRKEGLAWIIMEIFYMNKKILISYFPKYLDIDSIHYIFKIANINIRIIQLEAKVKEKKDKLHNYIDRTKESSINNIIKKYLFDNTEENINNYEYNKKQLSSLISLFSKKLSHNVTANFSMNEHSYKEEKETTATTDFDDTHMIKKHIFKTSKNLSNIKTNKDSEEAYNDYIYKNAKKRQYKINELQKFFDENSKYMNSPSFKENDTLKSNEFQTYLNLSNELFQLKQEKEKLKFREMDRIFKEFQKNNYQKRFQVDKKTVINALIGEDNVQNEMFKQSKKEKEYIYKMNKIQLFQNKYKIKKKME